MTGFVLDCSVAVAWCFEDEASADMDALLGLARDEGAVVPTIWPLEVGNVLLQAERRGRITSAGVGERLGLLATLPIEIDPETSPRAFREVLLLARSERLTTYDAAYLELAARRGVPLATQDRAVQRAAKRIGVPMLPAP